MTEARDDDIAQARALLERVLAFHAPRFASAVRERTTKHWEVSRP